MSDTSIQWTNKTWNPVRGCSMAKGSEAGGCLNCYAARMAARNLPELKSPTTGKSFARILDSGPRWTGEVELIESQLTLPLKWRKPQKIFVNSMSDLFHEALPDEAIDRVFAVMALCPQHTFQILTKRPERMAAWFAGNIERRRDCVADQSQAIQADWCFPKWPLPNVWLGVSVENQATADARIPLLLHTPAAIRFVSYEPALGPVDFDAVSVTAAPGFFGSPLQWHHRGYSHKLEGVPYPVLDWIIVGGESGPGARPFDVRWARNTVEQCKAAGVSPFVKQLGAKPVQLGASRGETREMDDCRLLWGMKDRKGGDPQEWPEDLRVREFPEVRS